MNKKDTFDFYCELSNHCLSTREEIRRRAKFLEYLEKYRDVKVASRVWDKVTIVMLQPTPFASSKSKEYFEEMKQCLVRTIKHRMYDNVGNWVDSNSDFAYAINAVCLWAEIVGFFNNGKV